jgi:hypothetical protein
MKALGPAGYAKTIFFIPHGVLTVMKPIMLAIMTPVEFLSKLTAVRTDDPVVREHDGWTRSRSRADRAARDGGQRQRVLWIALAPLIMAIMIMVLRSSWRSCRRTSSRC